MAVHIKKSYARSPIFLSCRCGRSPSAQGITRKANFKAAYSAGHRRKPGVSIQEHFKAAIWQVTNPMDSHSKPPTWRITRHALRYLFAPIYKLPSWQGTPSLATTKSTKISKPPTWRFTSRWGSRGASSTSKPPTRRFTYLQPARLQDEY